MTTIKLRRRGSPSSRRSGRGSLSASSLCLLFALTWPLLFYILFPSSGSGPEDARPPTVRGRAAKLRGDVKAGIKGVGKAARHLLSQYELAGYGPSHPRVGVVVTGECSGTGGGVAGPAEAAADTVSSLFATTDRNRILVVTVVMDGCSDEDVIGMEDELLEIDAGRRGEHRHGDDQHRHRDDEGGGGENRKKERNKHEHGRKLHLIVNPPPLQGLSASRAQGASFVRILAQKHEEAGLKDADEDILLVFLRAGAVLRDTEPTITGEGSKWTAGGWLDAVTPALVLAPGARAQLAADDAGAAGLADDGGGSGGGFLLHPRKKHAGDTVPHATKLANAVSFLPSRGTAKDDGRKIIEDEVGGTITVDSSLGRLVAGTVSTDDFALSNGESYPTPVINGWGVALRLEAYLDLPASDPGLVSPAAADLELSLNLWLCADGVDVLPHSARIAAPASALEPEENGELPLDDVVRIVAAWTEKAERTRVLRFDEETADDLIEMADKLQAEEGSGLPANLVKKCRGLEYFAELAGWNRDESAGGRGDRKAELAALRKKIDAEKKKKKKKRVDDEGALHPNIDEDHRHEAHRKPEKPLSKTNMAIVKRAGQIESEFVPVPNGKDVDHPHKGARDENGKWGYVHDAAALHRSPPPPFGLGMLEKRKACRKGDADYKMLSQKVVVDQAAHEAAERSHHKRVKLMCIVYTIEKYHDKIPAIRETWGQKCDGFMVASTKTDKKLGTVEIVHEGEEEYHNIYQKVRAIWSYVYDHYYDEFDYFHIGGDDMYVIVENLRLYLESEDVQTAQNGGVYLPSGGPAEGDGGRQTPLFLGRRMAEGGDLNQVFNSGGSGYTLNRAALKTLVEASFPRCMPHLHTFSEDVLVARCLRKHGVVPYDTKDENMGERYMPFQPGHHYKYRPPEDITEDWYSQYSIDVKWGLDHCAAKSVAFHYISPELMKRMHALLYGHCS